MLKTSLSKNSSGIIQPLAEGGWIRGSYLSQGYLPESERNNATRVRTHSLWCCNPMLYSHEQLYICMQNHNDDTIKTSGHTSLAKYTSHFIWKGSKGLLKVLLCESRVGDWTELQHIDPHSYGHNNVSFPFSWAAQPGGWGSSLSGTWSSFQHLLSKSSEALNSNRSIGGPEGPLCWVLVLSTASYLQLTDFLSSPGLYNCSTPTFFLWASQIALNSTRPRSRSYPDIPRPDALVIYTGAFLLTAWPGSICNTSTLNTTPREPSPPWMGKRNKRLYLLEPDIVPNTAHDSINTKRKKKKTIEVSLMNQIQ